MAKHTDNKWYRGLILGKSNEASGSRYNVFFLDYGNSAILKRTE